MGVLHRKPQRPDPYEVAIRERREREDRIVREALLAHTRELFAEEEQLLRAGIDPDEYDDLKSHDVFSIACERFGARREDAPWYPPGPPSFKRSQQ